MSNGMNYDGWKTTDVQGEKDAEEYFALEDLYSRLIEDEEFIGDHLYDVAIITSMKHKELHNILLKTIMAAKKEERSMLFEEFTEKFYMLIYTRIMSSPELLDKEE